MARDTYVGKAIKRVEDPRFLTGAGQYTDDITLHGMVHVAMVRSPFAHARINRIDASRALAHPGVLAVITGADLRAAGYGSIPTAWRVPGIKLPPHYAIAVDKARHVGEIIAAVVAEDRATAEDAAALVDVDLDPLPAVAIGSKALAAGAPAVHDDAADSLLPSDAGERGMKGQPAANADGEASLLASDAGGRSMRGEPTANADGEANVCFRWKIGDKAATDAQFAKAAKTVSLTLRNHRLVPNAIEPRCSIGQYIPASDELTLWSSSQNPHVTRLILAAFVMGIPEHKLRVISPDVGGGFGSKIFQYPEEVIVLHAAKTLRRPVKWTARRTESFVSDSHGRDHETEMELAVDAQGKVLGLRGKTVANVGAYLTLFGVVTPTYLHGTLLNGAYRFPAISYEVTAAFTHTTAVDALRGAGRPEATYIVERMMDRMALELGEDPAEFRRKNFVQPDQFPYQTPVALLYDSGNYEVALDKALAQAGYAALRAEQVTARAQGRYIGIGLSSWVEACGLAPSAIIGTLGAQAGLWESALVRVMPSGKIEVHTGSHSHGQGHETAFAQIAADELQVPMEDITIVHGDSAKGPFGWGTYGSRSGPVGGGAIKLALGKINDKATRIAAHLLEAAPEDIEHVDGKYAVKGVPERAKGFGEIALMAYLAHNYPPDLEPGLEATAFYDPKNWVYPFGTHIAVVEVDADTGRVTLKRYIAIDDCGTPINPLIIDGQVHGGVAHGVGQALLEDATYDDQAQLTSGSFLDYTMPRADDLPAFETGNTITPSPHNPLGVKGIGEAGTIASTAAVANAVVDALRPFGLTHLDMPFTAEKVWRAMQRQTKATSAA